MYCSNCGALLPTSARFCSGCGRGVDSTTEGASTSRTPMVPSQAKIALKKGASFVGSAFMWTIIIIGGVVGSYIGKSAFRPSKPTAQTVRSQLQAEIQPLQSKLPQVIDAQTRWDTAQVGQGNQIVYGYTLLGFKGAEIDLTTLRTSVFPGVVANACSKLQQGIAMGVTFTFTYFGSDGVYVDSLSVDKAKCAQAKP